MLWDLKLEIFHLAKKYTFVFKKFRQISLICIWIKSCGWRYCVVRNVVLYQHLSWCSGIHWLWYIPCWQTRRQRLSVCQRLLHIDKSGQFFSVSCMLWVSVVKISLSNYWCLQTNRQIKNFRVYNKIEWNFVINFSVSPCIYCWQS